MPLADYTNVNFPTLVIANGSYSFITCRRRVKRKLETSVPLAALLSTWRESKRKQVNNNKKRFCYLLSDKIKLGTGCLVRGSTCVTSIEIWHASNPCLFFPSHSRVCWVHHVTGMWVYPFLEHIGQGARIIFFGSTTILMNFLYLLGEILNNYIWDTERSKYY